MLSYLLSLFDMNSAGMFSDTLSWMDGSNIRSASIVFNDLLLVNGLKESVSCHYWPTDMFLFDHSMAPYIEIWRRRVSDEAQTSTIAS